MLCKVHTNWNTCSLVFLYVLYSKTYFAIPCWKLTKQREFYVVLRRSCISVSKVYLLLFIIDFKGIYFQWTYFSNEIRRRTSLRYELFMSSRSRIVTNSLAEWLIRNEGSDTSQSAVYQLVIRAASTYEWAEWCQFVRFRAPSWPPEFFVRFNYEHEKRMDHSLGGISYELFFKCVYYLGNLEWLDIRANQILENVKYS